jgi:hypothetical protein
MQPILKLLHSCIAMLCGLMLVPVVLCAQVQQSTVATIRLPEITEERPLVSGEALMPFVFWKNDATQSTWGVRPFFYSHTDYEDTQEQYHVLYPLYSLRIRPEQHYWNFLTLLRGSKTKTEAGSVWSSLELWPVYWSKQTEDPELSYWGVFPLYGTLKKRLYTDRLHWFAFPFYVESENRGTTTSFAPWPFWQIEMGNSEGFAFWPLWGHFSSATSERGYVLWPLTYWQKTKIGTDDERLKWGVLPFYTYDSAHGSEDRSYLWPFFGFTDKKEPLYLEHRYFWPLVVQAEGTDYSHTRYWPFYTNTTTPEKSKSWFLWPLVKSIHYKENNIRLDRLQLLYWFYYRENQRTASGRKVASIHHVWPLFSYWHNGDEQHQFQLLSPLSVFFNGNPIVRDNWNPLFALYRYEQQTTQSVHKLLWGWILFEKGEQNTSLRIGPLLTYTRNGEQKHFLWLSEFWKKLQFKPSHKEP